jgi:hypothetical protein
LLLRFTDLSRLLTEVLRWEKILPCLLLASLPALLFFSLSLYIMLAQGFEVMEVLRDPAQQSGASSFLGFLSNIGIWMWVSAAAICFFTVLTRSGYRFRRHRELMILLGVFSVVLAVDDFFMLHDRYINQWLCYAAYVVVAVALFLRHSEVIVQIDGFAFLLALALLGASITTDTFQSFLPLEYATTQIFEEGFKFTGAVTWLYFSGQAARSGEVP